MSTLSQFFEKEKKGSFLRSGTGSPIMLAAPEGYMGYGYFHSGAGGFALDPHVLYQQPAWDDIVKFSTTDKITDSNYKTIIDIKDTAGYLVTCILPGVNAVANVYLKITKDETEIELKGELAPGERMIYGNAAGTVSGRGDNISDASVLYTDHLEIKDNYVFHFPVPVSPLMRFFITPPNVSLLQGCYLAIEKSLKVEMKTDSFTTTNMRDRVAVCFIKA